MSFTTIYRAIVMIATGVIVVKGWQLYGPSTDQVKLIAVEAMEMAQTAWNRSRQDSAEQGPAADPRSLAPPLIATESTPAVDAAPAFPTSAPNAVPNTANAGLTEAQIVPDPGTPTTTIDNMSSLPADDADRLPALLSRLEAMGGVDPQLAQWGASGKLHRFCCRATLAHTPAYARHFEAVAAEPIEAVEQVVANVEAWRSAQREQSTLR